jgi:hypothetical protein
MVKAKEMEFVQIATEKLVPYEKNAKKHDKAQVARIAESIKRFGWDQPIVVDAGYVIIKGHGRRLAAIELGLKTVPVIVRADLNEEQVRAARLADNRAAISDIDTELFRKELETLNSELLAGIFDEKELDFSMSDLGDMNTDVFIADIDAAVKEQEDATKGKIEEAANRRVPIVKALGFKDIRGSNELAVSRFVAHMEFKTGKTGEDAFIDFIKSVLKE